MILFRLVIFLTIILIVKSISCLDQHCNSCKSYVRNNITFQQCTSCQYLWYIGNSSCIKAPICQVLFCVKCDPNRKYCIECDQYCTLGTSHCQLKPYMIGIISSTSGLIILIIIIVLTRYYCKRIILGVANDQSIQNLDPNSNHINMIESLSNLPLPQNINQNKKSRTFKKIKQERKSKGLINFIYKLQKNQIFPCQDQCTICLQNHCNVITQCNHHFHILCIVFWVQKRNKCPLCNMQLDEEIKIITCYNCRDQYETYNINEINQQDAKIYNKKLFCPACKDKDKSNLMELRDITQPKYDKQRIQ